VGEVGLPALAGAQHRIGRNLKFGNATNQRTSMEPISRPGLLRTLTTSLTTTLTTTLTTVARQTTLTTVPRAC
jgi:hypothetical protein